MILISRRIYWIIGSITRPNARPLNGSAEIYSLDIRNYTWVDRFEPENNENSVDQSPNPTNPSVPPVQSNDQLKTIKIAVGIIGGVLGIAIFVTIGIFGYKWYKKRSHNEILRITGNAEYN